MSSFNGVRRRDLLADSRLYLDAGNDYAPAEFSAGSVMVSRSLQLLVATSFWLGAVNVLSAQPRPTWSPSRGEQTRVVQAEQPPELLPQPQPLTFPRAPAKQAPVGERIQLNIGPDFELRALVELVIQRLGMNVIYDEEQLALPLNLRTPKSIPLRSLLPLLQTVLRANGLAMQDASVPGWKQIVPTNVNGDSRLAQVAPLRRDATAEDAFRGEPITRVFQFDRADVTEVEATISTFLSPDAVTSSLPDERTLIVSDFASNLARVDRLMSVMEQGGSENKVEFRRLEHTSAPDVAARLGDLLQAMSEGKGNALARAARVSVDERTNQLLVVGTTAQIREVMLLVDRLDAPSRALTRVYSLKNTSAERMSELVDTMLGETARIKSAVDLDGNKLIVTGPEQAQQRVARLVKTVDVERSRAQSPVRFYKLKNVTAVELLQTLRSLENGQSQQGAYGFGGTNIRGVSGGTRGGSRGNRGGVQPITPGGTPFIPTTAFPSTFQSSALPAPAETLMRGQQPESSETPAIGLSPGSAKVTADETTNTVIVVAEPEEQRVYEELIRALDQRRPQVMVEARLVLIDTSDDFTLGVEVSGGDSTGDKRAFAFTSYGLSTVDAATGALSLVPGRGFNGTLIDPDVADVVVRALTRHTRARVLSAPRLVVYDNATGVLTSVEEEPFLSTNINNVASTTAFAGFAEAGTTIEVTPHISGDDYLRLDYTITVNTFTGTATTGSPPPRKTDEIVSTVTIPDGHTVIVGGLNQQSVRRTNEGVPFLEKIPLIRLLGGNETDMSSSSSLFVFLRPVILRDDKFRKLRALSEIDVRRAHVRGDFPQSEPVLVK